MAKNILGDLVWRITGDTKDFDKKITGAEKKADTFGQKISKAGGLAVKAFTNPAFIIGVVAAQKKLVDLASSAEETANKFNVVFNGLSDASQIAQDLSSNYGLAERESKELLASTADLVQGFGIGKEESLALSKNVQELAVDLASFSNFAGGAKGASQALTSALLGEREAVKALGIAITETGLKEFAEEQGLVFEELDKGEKAILTYELAVRQSQNAIGDFARSQDSFANQSRILSSQLDDLGVILGEQLLPAFTDTVTTVNDILGPVKSVADAFFSFTDAIDGALDRLGPFREAVELVANPVVGLNKLYIGLAKTVGGFFQSEEDVTEELEQQGSLLDTISTKQVGITSDAQSEAEARGRARQEAQRLLDLARGSSDELIQQAENVDAAIIAGILSEEQGLERKIQLREAALNALRDEAIASGNTTREVVGAIQAQEAAIARYNARLVELSEVQEESQEIAGGWPDVFTDWAEQAQNVSQSVLDADAAFFVLQDSLTTTDDVWKEWYDNADERLKALSNVGINSLLSGFESIGEALVQGELSWKSFGQVAVLAIADVLSALGSQLAAQAAALVGAAFFSGGGSLAGLPTVLAGSAAAFAAAGALRASVAEFEEGGIVGGNSFRGDRVPALVNSGEMILNREQQAQLFKVANGGGGGATNVYIGGKLVASEVARSINNGQATIKLNRGAVAR